MGDQDSTAALSPDLVTTRQSMHFSRAERQKQTPEGAEGATSSTCQ